MSLAAEERLGKNCMKSHDGKKTHWCVSGLCRLTTNPSLLGLLYIHTETGESVNIHFGCLANNAVQEVDLLT